ncbi:MAG TPA: hypothetical protein DCM01_09155 [Dielma fastidiosa]|nr:hypothetical protein [Dielma fastidiosa]
MLDFFKNIEEQEIKLKKGRAVILIRDAAFGGRSVNTIAQKLKYILNHYSKIEIEICIKSRTINDMATITVLEYLIYYTIKKNEFIVKVKFRPNQIDYTSNFLENSLIGRFIQSTCSNKKASEQFIKEFESQKTIIGERSFRKLIKNDENTRKALNAVSSDISWFLKDKIDSADFREDSCEAITELCANVLDHTSSDCIVSMECGRAINKNKDARCRILSVVVSNVSQNLIYDRLAEYYVQGKVKFNQVDEAYKYHKDYFLDGQYNKERFYMVSVFQKGVSTRENQYNSGGTGLFKLIDSILGRTVGDNCYVLSGNNILFLREDKIKPVNGYIGFNSEHNYISRVPDSDIFTNSGMYYNGTLIHLMLVLGEEEEHYGD